MSKLDTARDIDWMACELVEQVPGKVLGWQQQVNRLVGSVAEFGVDQEADIARVTPAVLFTRLFAGLSRVVHVL